LYDHVYVMMSDQAPAVFATEIGRTLPQPFTPADYIGDPTAHGKQSETYENVTFLSSKDYFTPPASGSFRHDGMVIIPCSMGTLGRIANGISNDLTTRAADVCLKERRKLIVVARETPLNLIHLRNMVAVTEAGAIVLPAAPAFYHQPKTIEDLVDTVVARILQNLGVNHDLQPEWSVD
jgi:4-hydroxy-3-polyprenylbenzoate decarboxylase